MSDLEQSLVTLRLPSTLSAYSGGKSQIVLPAETLEQLFAVLKVQHPQIWEHLCTEQGLIRAHVKVFVSNKLIIGAEELKIDLKPGQEIIVLPATFGI